MDETQMRRQRGGAKARGMVLRWALLKTMGPDRWHYHGMLNAARFEAFRGALARAVDRRPDGCSVADLGAGHGLLAAAAESLGAKPVTRYERLVPLAKIQMAIARANGLALRVLSALPGDDSDEEEEEDAGAKESRAVDVAVIEVWEPTLLGGQHVGVLGNGLLEAVGRARKCGLIGAKTQVIPSAVTLVAAAVHVPAQTELVRCPLEDVSGFDLSKFSTFCPDQAEPCCLQHLKHTLLTAPAPVFSLELNAAREIALAETGSLSVPVTSDGVCNAVVFWHDMRLDSTASLQASPGSTARQAIYFIHDEVMLKAGSSIKLSWHRYNDSALRFSVEGGALATRHIRPGTQVVQRWHFGMLNDYERNDAYYKALRNQVRPGMFVLDIGAGTGLLGMMAARAGAGKVYATAIECAPQPAPLSRPLTEKLFGWDFSEFDQFSAPSYEQIRLLELDHRPLTQVRELDMDGSGLVLDTSPANTNTCWKQALQFFPKPVKVEEGNTLCVWVSNDETRISFSLSAPAPPDDD